MAAVAATAPPRTVAELLERLGGLPAQRVRMHPPPGTAREADVLQAWSGPDRRICELVEGALVEKPLGSKESLLAAEIIRLIGNHVQERGLGVVLGEAGMLRLAPGLVRIPDVSFIAWENVPGEQWPDAPIADIAPDLAVEVLSESNTPAEINRKLREYFEAGTRLAWVIDPKKQTARSYTTPDEPRAVPKAGALDGGDVLPGLRLPLPALFACVSRPKRPKK